MNNSEEIFQHLLRIEISYVLKNMREVYGDTIQRRRLGLHETFYFFTDSGLVRLKETHNRMYNPFEKD